jgi:excisionase family DNA binding protein
MEKPEQEFLTVEQFAERVNISRSTAYNWLAQGRLTTGRHVLRIGGVIRIICSDGLLSHLLALSAEKSGVVERPRLKRNGKGGKNRLAFDISYFDKN